jgi:biopolymer transport protein ExbD
VPRRERTGPVGFNITPMIDVVFLLVIFFLVVSHFAQSEQVADVELPLAINPSEDSDTPRRLTVSVTGDGRYFVKGRGISAQEVEQLIRTDTGGRSADYEVRLRTDRQTRYADVEPILLSALRTGVTRLSFAVTEP